MLEYLKRLVSTGAAYQFAEILAKGIAVFTLPLYTRHVSTAGYGTYNSLLTAVILFSIVLRLGVGEAFVRFYFTDADEARRARIARTATATVAWTTTLASLLALVFAGQLSRLLLGYSDATLMACAILGLWAFTNLEMAYAQLRVDERKRAYMIASGANVAMTVVFTIALVVFAGQGARGLLLGNFGASALVVLGLWWALRARVLVARARRGPARDARFRPADRARGRQRLCPAGRRPLLFAARRQRGRRRRVRDRRAARDGRVRVRARLSVRLAAAGLLDRQRRPGRAPVLAGNHLLRAGHRRRRRRRRAARALAGAPAGRARVLRRLPGAAVAGPGLDAVRALPGDDRDHRARAGHPAQPARRRRRARGQPRRCCSCSCPRPAWALASPAPGSRCAARTSRC